MKAGKNKNNIVTLVEKSYDILPNFTAADVNRFLGIGRNQYIDIMNKVRSKVPKNNYCDTFY